MTSRVRAAWPAALAVIAAAGLSLSACAGNKAANDLSDAERKTLRGADEIGVNSFLWRASLDTLKFLPLSSADPYGGVIITDWYANPEVPNERFKATVYILDTRLRADALSIAINKQQLTVNGWSDVAIDPDAELQIENAILTRARQLRLDLVR